MAKVYFVCGFIGSGKTSYSKKFAEQVGAFRFTIDEWILPLFGEHLTRQELDQYSDNLLELFKRSALDMLKLNVSVILDFGFWQKSNRDDLRTWADQNAVELQLIYLDTSFEECCKRALARNSGEDNNNYTFTQKILSELWKKFEAPQEDELKHALRVN